MNNQFVDTLNQTLETSTQLTLFTDNEPGISDVAPNIAKALTVTAAALVAETADVCFKNKINVSSATETPAQSQIQKSKTLTLRHYKTSAQNSIDFNASFLYLKALSHLQNNRRYSMGVYDRFDNDFCNSFNSVSNNDLTLNNNIINEFTNNNNYINNNNQLINNFDSIKLIDDAISYSENPWQQLTKKYIISPPSLIASSLAKIKHQRCGGRTTTVVLRRPTVTIQEDGRIVIGFFVLIVLLFLTYCLIIVIQ